MRTSLPRRRDGQLFHELCLECHKFLVAQVVLCGHSQGSLISFATLVRQVGLGRDLEQVGLLTFGSQIQVLFSRAFPAAVNLPAAQGLMEDLGGRWRNLYRDTDRGAAPLPCTSCDVPAGWPPDWRHLAAAGAPIVVVPGERGRR